MKIKSCVVCLLACAVALSAGCEALGRAQHALAELMAVQRAVQQRVGASQVNVNISNGTYLSVSIVNSPFHVLPAEQKKTKARELAKVAFDAYAGRARLQRVGVVFVVQSGFLFFHFTSGLDAHMFEAEELRGDPAAPRASS